MQYNTRTCSTAEEHRVESGGAVSVDEVNGTEAEGMRDAGCGEKSVLHDWEQSSGVLTGVG